MESNGKPGKIHMSNDACSLLNRIGGYEVESRGEVIIKGKGVMETYWLNARSIGTTTLPIATLRKDDLPPPTKTQEPPRFTTRTSTTPPMDHETRMESSSTQKLPDYDEIE
ncbi:unnamed protein product, partial [Mesorhabditis belari]|uniref:Guanylate cyclase domain-containing protein n=1 Tax=Mesorhabditis belari TaxID=2138241 RepID=A0AAF3EE17_9BILA